MTKQRKNSMGLNTVGGSVASLVGCFLQITEA